MQRYPTLAVLVLALAAHAKPASALGFGRVVGSATLGQLLDVSVVLRTEPGESIEPECVQAAVTSGDRRLPSPAVRTSLTSGAGGERRLRVVTTIAIDEPIVTLDLSAGCPTRLARQFVVFADPPSTQSSAPVAPPGVTTPPTAEAPADARAESPAAPARPASTARQRTRATGERAPTRGEVAPREATAAAPSAPRNASRRSAKPSASTPVLRLDPIEEEAQSTPMLRMDTELAALPAPEGASRPLLAEPETEGQRRDRERVAALEETLKRLQDVEQQRNQKLARAEAQLRDAQAHRLANPLVLGLLALCAALLAAVGVLLWRRRRDRREAAWWQQASAMPEANPAPAEAETAAMNPPPPVLEDEPSWEERTVVLAPTPPRPAPVPPAPPAAFVTPPLYGELDGNEPSRPMSAEELLDLEQQAEFFVVLGQDEAAIDLLMSHLRSTGGVSPVPYLKLLEIYRRRGDKEAHERMRERFNRRFNAYTPEWDVDPEQGQTLESYPDVLARLQAAWPTPTFAMELLDAALFRRDNGPTFDVPAYRELLFLYGVARDLAERAIETDGVDLLLPFEDTPPAPQPLQASAPAASVLDDEPLSLDLTLDEPPPGPASGPKQPF
jgi:hypothetical protein